MKFNVCQTGTTNTSKKVGGSSLLNSFLFRTALYIGLMPVAITILLAQCIYFFLFHGVKSTLDSHGIAQSAANDLCIGFCSGKMGYLNCRYQFAYSSVKKIICWCGQQLPATQRVQEFLITRGECTQYLTSKMCLFAHWREE